MNPYFSPTDLSRAFARDLVPDQSTKAQTLFLKKLSLPARDFFGGTMQTVPMSGLQGFDWFSNWHASVWV